MSIFFFYYFIVINIILVDLTIILEIPGTLSQLLHMWFWFSISGNSSEKLHCGNVVNMLYWIIFMYADTDIHKSTAYQYM